MTDWVFVLVPLLVLPIILLFRFVGCGLDTKGEVEELVAGKGSFPYKDTILAEPDVIAYWRLIDEPPTATVAKDEKGSFAGEYKIVPPPGLLDEASTGSEAAGGGFFAGPSLIAFHSATSRIFNGGHVLVAKFAELSSLGVPVFQYPEEDFTIEAWINPQWTQQKGYEHTLVDASGHYQKFLKPSKSWHGFRIFADRQNRWQVYLAQPNGSADPVKIEAAPIVVHNAPTYLAVTVETVTDEADPNFHKKKVRIFVNGKMAEGIANTYSPPDGAPLFIGVSNRESDPSNPPKPRHPVLSPIQEVVLYKKALSPGVIKKHHDAGKGVA